MTAIVGTLGRMRSAAEHNGLVARLGGALNSLFDRWTDDPALICGDADSSLVAIGRDLQTEARLLYRRSA
ncbi:MAG TPA: hypothetical protein VFE37_21115 [Chloroflexota bacterium]|nr:hypothetical protein [Chloroflexota bacterium]